MGEGSSKGRKWHASAHARLCLLGWYLRLTGFFRPLEEGVKLRQKVLKYTAVQKLEMLLVSLLAGAQALAHSGRMLRAAPARRAAFGLPGCAEQAVLADTRDAATAGMSRICGGGWRPPSSAAATRGGMTATGPCCCWTWTCRRCRPAGLPQARSAAPWGGVGPRPAASWCGGAPASTRRQSGRRSCPAARWSRWRSSSRRCRRPSGCWTWRATARRPRRGGRGRSGGWMAAGAPRRS